MKLRRLKLEPDILKDILELRKKSSERRINVPKYHVLGFNRILDRVALIASNLTAAQAEKECNEWGWTYNDGIELRSYTMTIIPADKYDLQDILGKPYSKGLSFIIEEVINNGRQQISAPANSVKTRHA